MHTRAAAGPSTDLSPTIKGIFVMSHVNLLRRERGEAAVDELQRLYGRPLDFRAGDDIPVRDEVRLIELTLDIRSQGAFAEDERAFEAGRLHFRNFATTPWAKMIFGLFPRNFHYMMMHASGIAEMVFKGVNFQTESLGTNGVRVVMEHNDYPLDHFRGLFQQWMDHFGYDGEVTAVESSPNVYEYTMRWR